LGHGVTDTAPRLRGGRVHRIYTVVVFIVLAALDNVAIALPPPLLSPISGDLGVRESTVAAAVALSFLLTAVSAVAWAYLGDRSDRKRLLMTGTLLWAAGVLATSYATTYPGFLVALALAAIGLGTVASVGFSVVSDLISPRRRGLVMGLWGLSQGLGSLAGVALGGVVGADDWRMPFRILAAVGVAATVAYLFTHRIQRGESEPELAGIYQAGGEYEHRIRASDLPRIVRRRTNVWLAAQGLTAQIAYGSLFWLPRLLQAKAEDLGYPQQTAIVIGSVFTVLILSGGVLSLVGAMVGDRLRRRTPRARAMVASIGVLSAVPLFIILFFFPLRLDLPLEETGRRAIMWGVARSLVTEPAMGFTFLVALVAIGLLSANSPNWYALISEVNPPEHRGTAFSFGNMVNGVGRTIGTDLTVRTFEALERTMPPPLNFAVGLAAFQLFFIPTGIMYWLASRTSPRDIAIVNLMLRRRARAAESMAAESMAAESVAGESVAGESVAGEAVTGSDDVQPASPEPDRS
jgi:MFS transporter, Spinster family, sphingosine-1-phosphate transporter